MMTFKIKKSMPVFLSCRYSYKALAIVAAGAPPPVGFDEPAAHSSLPEEGAAATVAAAAAAEELKSVAGTPPLVSAYSFNLDLACEQMDQLSLTIPMC